MEKIKVGEGHVKKAVRDYLEYQQNLGKLIYFRLNAGDFILTDKDGKFRRRVVGAKKGTADFMVIRCFMIPSRIGDLNCHVIAPDVLFIELKSQTGEQSPAQIEFQRDVEKQGCTYYIIRDVAELEEVLK